MLRCDPRGDMTDEARKDYISALHCLKGLPSQTDRDQYPGVRSRFDDFTIAHAINTGEVHRSPWLAVWHRQYVWAFETALRDECNYQHGTFTGPVAMDTRLTAPRSPVLALVQVSRHRSELLAYVRQLRDFHLRQRNTDRSRVCMCERGPVQGLANHTRTLSKWLGLLKKSSRRRLRIQPKMH